MDLDLSHRGAIVTGGSRGLGKAIARALAAEGTAVAIAARNPERLSDTALELAAETGGQVVAIPCDTRSDTSVSEMVAQAAGILPGIDILINGAAPSMPGASAPRLAELSADAFWEDINTKVLGYLRCIREVVPYMIKRGGGRIVNIAGMNAFMTGSTIGTVRNISVSALTKSLADELSPHRVAIVVVHPWFTRAGAAAASNATRAERAGTTIAEIERTMGERTLAGRLMEAHEIADAVTFLASPRAAAINGASVILSGGLAGYIHY